MKLLITGATGFLGRTLLARLLDDERITSLVAVTRTRETHPHPKVKVAKLDLSVPGSLASLACDVDAIVHIAGAYDFSEGYASNYLGNVLSMTNLLGWLKSQGAKIPVHYASTYAVQAGAWSAGRAEAPVDVLPDPSQSYAYSKALAERALRAAGVPSVVYRLGILVGDAEAGGIEKIDGPYYLMRFVDRLVQERLGRRLPVLPLPAKPRSFLPLVPVDSAAKAIHAGLFQDHEDRVIYGVYNRDSTMVDTLVAAVLDEFKCAARPLYIPRPPRSLGRLQAAVTGIPAPLFDFTNLPTGLANDRFERAFPDLRVPHFDTLRRALFDGFREYTGRRGA